MDRRRYLAAAGAAGIASLAGCPLLPPDEDPEEPEETEEPEEPPEEPTPADDDPPDLEERFENIVDLVEAGADPTGEERIDGILVGEANDDTLLRLPEGEYLLGNAQFEGYNNLGIVGDDARLIIDEQGRNMFFSFRDVSNIYVEGITADCTSENTAAWFDVRVSGGENVVRDYVAEGFGDVTSRTNGFTVEVAGEDTSLLIDRADLSDGALNGAATFVFGREFTTTDLEPGTLTFRDCVMKGWGKEGLYASEHSGPLNVIGGEYANNAIVQVRVGGGDASEEAVVRGVTVRIDEIPDYMPEYNRVLRGIWLKEGERATVEDCDIEIFDVDGGGVQGGIVVNGQFGQATIRSTEIRTEHDSPAVYVRWPVSEFDQNDMPSMTDLPEEWQVTLEDVAIDADSAVDAILLKNRDGSVLRDVTVEQRGDANGIRAQYTDDVEITGGDIVAGRYPIALESLHQEQSPNIYLDDIQRIESTGIDGDLLEDGINNPYVVSTDLVSGAGVGVTGLNDGRLYGKSVDRDGFD